LVRFNFTAEDLARTRFATEPAPLAETQLALIELRRATVQPGRARSRPWLREARQAFPPTARPLLELLGPRGPWPGFMDSWAPEIDEALDFVRGTPRAHLREELACLWPDRPGRPRTWLRNLADGDAEALEELVRALRDLHRAIVAPRWDNVLSSFHGDVARRRPLLAAGGHQALFDTLHRHLRWRHDGLERQGDNSEYDLGGGGLLLVPSVFWTGPPLFVTGEGGRVQNALVYAAEPAETGTGNDGLATLLGFTRAALLRALREPRTTENLATAVGISPSSASEHAKILRDADLIQTLREGRSVRHSLTPLGRTLLGYLRSAAD
jgi:DNA-binding transcriptional ArsR family regulator